MKPTRRLIQALGIAALPMALTGGPASPDLLTLKQPDGQTIQARWLGDEFQSWMETEEGYTILKNGQTGYWEYGILDSKSGGIKASGKWVIPNAAAPSDLAKHLKPARRVELERAQAAHLEQFRIQRQALKSSQGSPYQAAAVAGSKKLLIILVNFSNQALTTTATGWADAVFGTGSGVKSVRQFYRDNSFSQLDVVPVPHTQTGNPDGVVTVTLTTAHPNYGGDGTYAQETAWLNAALAQAAPYIDFAALDTNSNGTITVDEAVVYFVAAGYETSGSNKTPSIWAHAWGGTPGLTAGTKRINHWAMNGELNDASRQHPMGVIAHELGHAMTGLPDLYDTTYTNSGLGIFSLMASGSWGRDTGEDPGATPVSLDAWSRSYLGWTVPQTPAAGQTVTLGTCLSDGTAAAKLQNASISPTEYFLAENRYPVSWDRGMIRWTGSSWTGGLLIMHIDDAIDGNAYVAGNHQMVMAEHANNAAYGSVGTAASLFTASGNANFTPATTPSSAFYGGTSAIAARDISPAGTTMTFNSNLIVDNTPPTGKPGKPTGSTSSDTVTFAWTAGDAADADSGLGGYRLQVGTTPGAHDVFDGIVGTSTTKTLNDKGLYDGRPLYAQVAAMNGAGVLGNYSDPSEAVTVSLPTFDGSIVESASLPFKTIGPWTADATIQHTGGSSAKSAAIGNNSQTYLQAKVTGPATLNFYWKVSCEAPADAATYYDNLAFSIDGTLQERIGGEVDWTLKTYSVAAGTHILRWTYTKDVNATAGSDAAWVDQVSFQGQNPPTLTSFSPASACVGASVTITGTNLGDASAVKFNGTTAAFTVNGATQITATVPAGATTGTISVTNTSGTVTSASTFTVKSCDLNGDGRTDLKDLARIARYFGTTGFPTEYDLNGDGAIDEQDVTLLFANLN